MDLAGTKPQLKPFDFNGILEQFNEQVLADAKAKSNAALLHEILVAYRQAKKVGAPLPALLEFALEKANGAAK